MARKTYPNTPQEEADRINAASGDPTGISAAQVSNNRALNENLTAMFSVGASTKPSSGPGSNPVSPFSQLTAAISEGFEKATNEGQAALQNASSLIEKTKLDEKVSDLVAGAKSGLSQLAGDAKNFGSSAMGGNVTVNSAVGGAVDKLKSVDLLEEGTSLNKIKYYITSNSFFVRIYRGIIENINKKFNLNISVSKIETKVYGERDPNRNFIKYNEII
jgi:hypothetical protein